MDENLIIKSYTEDNFTVEEICKKNNISCGTLFSLLEKLGIKKRGHKKINFNIEEISLLRGKVSIRDLSKIYKCDRGTALKKIKEAGFPISDFKRIPKTKKSKEKKEKGRTKKFLSKKEEFFDLYFKEKKSVGLIAKKYNTSRTTIRRYLTKEFNFKLRTKKEFHEQIGFSEEHKKNISCSRKNKLKNNTKTNITSLIRGMPEYKEWRFSCYKRDQFHCVFCNKKKYLNADHIKPISVIIRQNNITNTIEARDCKELWDINNGRTLCEECHKQTDTFKGKAKTWIKHYCASQ